MSSGASVSALQRLVEQLKLEAGVERIKRYPGEISLCGQKPTAQGREKSLKYMSVKQTKNGTCSVLPGQFKGERSLRPQQSFSSTAYRMRARTPCCLVFQREATPSGSPGPVLCFEGWEAAR